MVVGRWCKFGARRGVLIENGQVFGHMGSVFRECSSLRASGNVRVYLLRVEVLPTESTGSYAG